MVATHDLLTLMPWLTPAFPTGAYACSHGLEQAIAVGNATDAATAQVAGGYLAPWHRLAGCGGAGVALKTTADHAALANYAAALDDKNARMSPRK